MRQYLKAKYILMVTTALAIMAMAVNYNGGQTVYAGVYSPTSLLDTGVETIINDFAADLKPTVLDLIAIIIPVGLALWAIGFGIKKGLAFLQRRANKTL